MLLPFDSLTVEQIENALRSHGVGLELHGYRCLITSDTGLLAPKLRQLYAGFLGSLKPSGFFDFRIHLKRKGKFKLKEVEFLFEGMSPFPTLPFEQAHPLFEWGLNWCVATASACDIVVHSAVLEKDGTAILLPGQPGSGKSTLCADLVLQGYRLLSDELTIINSQSGLVRPFPRPISLKNISIDVIAKRHPGIIISDVVTDTRKGDIAYIAPPIASVTSTESVPIGTILFPEFQPYASTDISPITKANALARLFEHTFNVDLLGESGFIAFAKSIDHADCFDIKYSNLDEISGWLNSKCR